MKYFATLGVFIVAFLFECAVLTAENVTSAGMYALSAVVLGITIFIIGGIWAD